MERKLAAILCADVYGFSRLMGQDEEATLRTLTSHRKLIDAQIENHHGRFVNAAGYSVLAEFASVVEAVNYAVDIQTGLKAENESIPPERRMEFRIGVNLGDVMVEGAQIYGDGVNVAARLESLAEPGGICISDTAHAQVRNKLALGYEDLGAQSVKNIAESVRVFRVLLNGTVAAPRTTQRTARRYWRGGVFSIAGLAIIVVTIVLVQHISLKPPRTQASIPLREKPALPLPSIPSIAVLPFINLSGDPQQEYFSDGITNQLINDLSRLPDLFVIARNSSFTYKGKTVKEQQIGKQLGVKYVLEGSAQKSSDSVRIGVELVDAASGTQIWAQRFDRPLKNIFAVQDEIVEKVVTTLGLILKQNELKTPHSSFRPTDNLEAYDDFLRGGECFWRFTKDDNAKARHWYREAIKLDPEYGEVYALLGWSYWADAWNQWSADPREDLSRASELAHKALALDDSNSSALGVLSYVDWMQQRFDQAVADEERAVALNLQFRPVDIINGEAKRTSGGAASSTRREMIKKFRESQGFNAIVLSPEVAGVGLTLVEANHVIHYGRWWNPATESQATDRAYRIGQTREVHVYYPIAKDPHNEFVSFDEKLHRIIERRRQMAEEFLTPQPTEADLQHELLDEVFGEPFHGSGE